MSQTRETARKHRTKEHFQLALIDLIKEKGFQTVTIKDIVQHAKYNRSTFYTHYNDKFELAEDLLHTMLSGLEASAAVPYQFRQKVNSSYLKAESFNIISYIYKHRNFFELITCHDTLPKLHTAFPQTVLKIYEEQFEFETINNEPVNIDYFKRYTAYGFYGLLSHWIHTGFLTSQEKFIEEVIRLSRTHIETIRYIGGSHES